MEMRLVKNETFRYLFIGGCTTLLNVLVFMSLSSRTILGDSKTGITIANTIAIIISMIFAYFTNKYIVFQSKEKSSIKEVILFFASRGISMLVEIGGVYVALNILSQSKLVAKIEVQILIIIILNYVMSKFIVFKAQD